MSTLRVYDLTGAAVAELDFPDTLLVTDKGEQAVHDAVVAHLAGLRAGTASTLGKGAVAGSGKKPHKQKGTGRARAGYRQSPVWRGGAVAFGPHPRDYGQRIPRKVAALAFRRAWSDKVVGDGVRVLERLDLSAAKTKECAGLLKKLGLGKGVLFIVDKPDAKLSRAVRNLPGVSLVTATNVSTYQVIRHATIVTTRAALDGVKQRLERQIGRAA
jgi:large subunit ribosomal protein L4